MALGGIDNRRLRILINSTQTSVQSYEMIIESGGAVIKNFSVMASNGSEIEVLDLTQCRNYTVTLEDGRFSTMLHARTGRLYRYNLETNVR